METRVEKRKRMKAERLRRAARFSMVFISAAVLISAWAALTTAGGSAGTLDTTPPKMLAIASDEPVAEAVRLTLHVDHESEEPMWSQAEVEAIAKTVYGEAMVTGSDEEMSAVAHLNVQPLSKDEIQALPEGEQRVKRMKAFGDLVFTTADQSTGRRGDWLFYQGKMDPEGHWYECVSSLGWDHTMLSHCRSEFVIVSEAEARRVPRPKIGPDGKEDAADDAE